VCVCLSVAAKCGYFESPRDSRHREVSHRGCCFQLVVDNGANCSLWDSDRYPYMRVVSGVLFCSRGVVSGVMFEVMNSE
jgi:hypothetical protein